jgi:hypothetical protein
MDRIAEIGFCDLWRRRNPEVREYSWFSTRGNGFRIDHAFLSPVVFGSGSGRPTGSQFAPPSSLLSRHHRS